MIARLIRFVYLIVNYVYMKRNIFNFLSNVYNTRGTVKGLYLIAIWEN